MCNHLHRQLHRINSGDSIRVIPRKNYTPPCLIPVRKKVHILLHQNILRELIGVIIQKRLFVHNSVCSQLEGLFAVLAECSQFCLRSFFNRNSRGNPSLCWLGKGGVKGRENCEQKFCEQTGVSCETFFHLQHPKTPRTPNLSKICPSDCFWGFQSGGQKFEKSCQNL